MHFQLPPPVFTKFNANSIDQKSSVYVLAGLQKYLDRYAVYSENLKFQRIRFCRYESITMPHLGKQKQTLLSNLMWLTCVVLEE